MFLDRSGVQWEPDPPNVDQTEVAMLAADPVRSERPSPLPSS
jgi:hypothetical protein